MTKRQRHADEVLKGFRKRRGTPACYPCSKRKVRCTGGRPCEACITRGHADICYEEGDRIESHVAARTSGTHVSSGFTTNTKDNDSIQQSRLSQPSRPTTLPEPRVGRFSAVNFIRDRLKGSPSKVPTGELHPTVGLGNTDGQLPALTPLGAAPHSMVPPKRDEVLRYYPPFKECVMPLYSVPHDLTLFESLIHDVLAGSKVEDAQMAVILACFALGAQFEEFAPKPRIPTSMELINRANVYLQRANYIFHPTMEAIQALLMIGMALQNAGRPDGAWNLLGLNYRLAQTLGLHLLDPNDGGPGATVWSTIIWQDCLLSCRYDRRPFTDPGSIIDLTPTANLSYYQALRSLCILDMCLLSQPHSHRFDIAYVHSLVRDVDNLLSRCCEHLSQNQTLGKTRAFHQRLQHCALKLHSSLFLADLCRPMFSITTASDEVHLLRQRGFDALRANIEAFLDIWSFSNIPLRQWSMTQATVSCAIVLALVIQDPRTKCSSTADIIALLRKLANVLKTGTGVQNYTVMPLDNLHGVCLMRIKGAGLLEAILDSHPDDISSSKLPGGNGEHGNREESATSLEIDSLAPEDLAWPADLPVFDRAFLAESVLDFDVDQAWYDENIPAVFD